MRRLIGLMALVFIGLVGWRIVDGMSSDAIGMAIGVLFGVLAGVPMALLILVADRRRDERRQPRTAEYGLAYPPYPQQPPVIVVTGAGGMAPGQQWGTAQATYAPSSAWDGPRPERRYRIVGEQEEWIDA